MAKATAKKEFSWDKEVLVKEIPVNDYEKRAVIMTELNGKEFIVISTIKKIKGDWKPVKNATIPRAIWGDIADAVTDFGLMDGFGSTSDLQAPVKPLLKGQKKSFEEKLAHNANFGTLPKAKQTKLVAELEKIHDDLGMVTVAISKTSYFFTAGMNQLQGEKQAKSIKGFARAQITYFA